MSTCIDVIQLFRNQENGKSKSKMIEANTQVASRVIIFSLFAS